MKKFSSRMKKLIIPIIFIGVALAIRYEVHSISVTHIYQQFDEAVTNNKYMMHALGGVKDKYKNTNSLDALKKSYGKGELLYEVDVRLTSDDVPVLVTGWQKTDYDKNIGEENYNSDKAIKGDAYIPTYDEFKEFMIQGSYLATSFKELSEYIRKHNDIFLLIDIGTKDYDETYHIYDQIVKASGNDNTVLRHLIPRGHTIEMWKAIDKIYDFPLKDYYYDADEKREDNLRESAAILEFCKKNNISTLSVDKTNFNDSVADILKESGLIGIIFTVNEEDDCIGYLDSGIKIIGTDYLRE